LEKVKKIISETLENATFLHKVAHSGLLVSVRKSHWKNKFTISLERAKNFQWWLICLISFRF